MLFLPLNVQCSSWSVDHLFTFGQFAQRSLGLQGLDFTTVMITPSQWTFWQNSICLEGRQHIELKIMHKKSTEMMLRKNLSIVLNVIIV